jgi:hypothetical protein
MKDKYNLVVTYEPPDNFLENNTHTKIDRKIEEIVKRDYGGAGFWEGGRDLSFWFSQKPAADRAMKRIAKFSSYKRNASLSIGAALYDVTTDGLDPIYET